MKHQAKLRYIDGGGKISNRNTKWIFVSGGVLSGLGKGIFIASLGRIFRSEDVRVVPIKCDGYLNVDPGTMNPIEHGEVFVLEDGGEVDMDFGHYERFLDLNCREEWNLTSGQVFKSIIDKERSGEFLGETVQLIPHVTNHIKDKLRHIADSEDADIVIVEVGGTVGDIENELYLEAIRQMKQNLPEEDSVYIHLTLVPYLESVGELKTKPTQHSVNSLQEKGIKPDIIVCRSEKELNDTAVGKISMFCNVEEDSVISNPDIENLYALPTKLKEQNIHKILKKKLDMPGIKTDIEEWKQLAESIDSSEREANIVLCGKYTELEDSYVSITEALKHASAHTNISISLSFLDSEKLEKGTENYRTLEEADGIIIPGGFGSRGFEGKIEIARYARNNKVPLLGICFGLQAMVIEFARNVCGLKSANSTEVDSDTRHPVVFILPSQREKNKKGGTMRLGAEQVRLKSGTLAADIYGIKTIEERFRHRYEVNPEYVSLLEEKDLVFSGRSTDEKIMQIVELAKQQHPFYFGVQFHPEFNSSLKNPSKVFKKFLESSYQNS